jgi:hypothetical protein
VSLSTTGIHARQLSSSVISPKKENNLPCMHTHMAGQRMSFSWYNFVLHSEKTDFFVKKKKEHTVQPILNRTPVTIAWE